MKTTVDYVDLREFDKKLDEIVYEVKDIVLRKIMNKNISFTSGFIQSELAIAKLGIFLSNRLNEKILLTIQNADKRLINFDGDDDCMKK